MSNQLISSIANKEIIQANGAEDNDCLLCITKIK